MRLGNDFADAHVMENRIFASFTCGNKKMLVRYAVKNNVYGTVIENFFDANVRVTFSVSRSFVGLDPIIKKWKWKTLIIVNGLVK